MKNRHRTVTPSFSRMSAKDKRIAIAKDVLKQIRAGQFNMESGVWLSLSLPDETRPETAEEANSYGTYDAEMTQRLLLGGVIRERVVVREQKVKPISCRCCAIGAACVSAVRLFNRHQIQDGELINDFNDALALLRPYFSKVQCNLIEAVFEHRSRTLTSNERDDFSDPQMRKIDAYPDDDEERAIAIFKNIIRNDGTFKL